MSLLRDAVTAERDRREWNNLTLSRESGVPYGRLHEWLVNGKTIHSDHVERLLATLGLVISRGRRRAGSSPQGGDKPSRA